MKCVDRNSWYKSMFHFIGLIELEPATETNIGNVIDMLSLQNGGRCLSYSNAHFGHPRNLLKPGRATGMMDGWETGNCLWTHRIKNSIESSFTQFLSARRLDRPPIIEMTEKDVFNIPGTEWAIFRLATTSTVVSIEVDTNHFKGNAPDYVTIEGTMQRGDCSTEFNENEWTAIIEKMRLQPHKQHSYKREIKNVGPFNCVRITIAPDGGVSRVRVEWRCKDGVQVFSCVYFFTFYLSGAYTWTPFYRETCRRRSKRYDRNGERN